MSWLFGGFRASKIKPQLKMAAQRITLTINKKTNSIKKQKREVAELLAIDRAVGQLAFREGGDDGAPRRASDLDHVARNEIEVDDLHARPRREVRRDRRFAARDAAGEADDVH